MAILPVGIGPVTGGYQIERSLRFNSADSAYLNRTPASAGNRDTWTYSTWIKRSVLSTNQTFFSARSDANNYDYCSFNTSDQFSWAIVSGGSTVGRLITTQVFRDVSSWYHFLVTYDSGNATGGNRMRFYVNGTEVTAFGTDTNPSQNQDSNINNTIAHNIGRFGDATEYCNYYQTETNFIDGQALTPSSFGQTNGSTGVWEPIAYTGTYGTNGFFLKFADNSGTTSTTLGKDSSGNGNNWTPNNFSVTAGAGNDSLVDTPTSYGTDTGAGGEVRGNYATWNPLSKNTNVTTSNGNLESVNSSAAWYNAKATIGNSSGKWYWECVLTSGIYAHFGIATGAADVSGYQITGVWSYGNDGSKVVNGTITAGWGATFTTNDIIGVAFNADDGTLTVYKNNVSQGTLATGLTSGPYFPFASIYQSTATINFGQRPFAYTAPSGFKALCTQNLPTPTIGATSTTQANKYFDVSLYTGNGTSQSIVNSGGFQPDFVWYKDRSVARDHALFNVTSGATYLMSSNNTSAESAVAGTLTSFNSNGYSIGSTANANANGETYVGWQWKGGGTGVTNTAGTITSTVSANTTSGFSIVTYTGTGATATVGHGLGVAPSMIIIKKRSDITNWPIYHVSTGATKIMVLNLTNAQEVNSAYWNDTAPTSSVFTVKTADGVNANLSTYVAYCFAEVAGYSRMGSYVGNGSSDGPFVFTNHRPAFLLIKRTDTTSNWTILDLAREGYNVDNDPLYPNLSNAEGTTDLADILSNGFKLRSTDASVNANTGTYIYMSLAANPFKYSLAR